MAFFLSPASLCHLQGVHPDLVAVVKRAIEVTTVDFKVIEGVRTEEEEAKCIAEGKSHTSHSRHLTGHAVDFMAIVGNVGNWQDRYYPVVAAAFRTASIELGIRLEWGGVWDRHLSDIEGDLATAIAAYVRRRRQNGLSAFIDADHVQLAWSSYP